MLQHRNRNHLYNIVLRLFIPHIFCFTVTLILLYEIKISLEWVFIEFTLKDITKIKEDNSLYKLCHVQFCWKTNAL